MGQSVIQVDAFADRAFVGNPAAVCVSETAREAGWMQAVAGEMNLSETAFLYPEAAKGAGVYALRWFTPDVEVDLCGHATLAAGHVLWTEGHLDPATPALFETRSGRLFATRDGDWITLDFPATPVDPARPADPDALARILGVPVSFSAYNRFDVLAEVASEAVLRGLRPDFAGLSAEPVRGLIVTSRAETPGFDFVSRFFAPAVGVDEDPVTGSAHCCLGPYWSARLGKNDLTAYQASARGGVVRIGVRGDRVRLGGRAVTVLRGELVGAAGG